MNDINYDYYKIYDNIYRVPRDFYDTVSKVITYWGNCIEIYDMNKWLLSTENYLSLQKAKKLTKEEAFMELL